MSICPGWLIHWYRVKDLLLDIQQEFRHILYHIHDPQIFRVLEPTHGWLTVAEVERS